MSDNAEAPSPLLATPSLTEEQVLAILRRKIREYPSMPDFCRANNLPYSTVFAVVSGTYNNGRGSIPYCIQVFLGVKKRVTVTYDTIPPAAS